MFSSSRVTLPLQAGFRGVGESRGGTQCHSYVRVGKALCITILFSLKKPEIDSLNWIFSCLLWDSSPFLTLSHQQTQ